MIIELIIFIFLLICLYWYHCTKRPDNYPPGPKWLPIFGNSPLLRKTTKILHGQHKVFEYWRNVYRSPVLGLKLGGEYVVIASTYPIVREVHTRDEFDGRPDNYFFRLRTMGTRLGITSVDGQLWIDHRNFTVKHLRQAGFGRQPMDVQINAEINGLIKTIDQHYADRPIWPGELLPPIILNILWKFTAGTKISQNPNDNRLNNLLELMQKRAKAFDMAGGLINQFPWLRYLAPEATGYNLINTLNQQLYNLFMEQIREHKQSYTDEKSSDDLIYAYIREQRARESNDINSTFTDQQLIMIIIDLFIAGSQTTSTTLDLAFMIMAVHPTIQKRIHEELAAKAPSPQTSGDGIETPITINSSVSERKQLLPYTNAVLMEVQRYFNIIPITGPRCTLRGTTLANYCIPKNTTILIDLHSVHMDRDHWGDPDVFRPERFLDNNQLNIINAERLMPFGQGKRKCLGDSLARSCLVQFFTGILQVFEILPICDGTDKIIIPSLDLNPGIILTPNPYKIVFKRKIYNI